MARDAALPNDHYAYGFPRWKRPVLRQCFPGRRIVFLSGTQAPTEGACVILWGIMPVPAHFPPPAAVIRVEDGFLRSVGLGADLVRPLSWVADRQGIYYDATRPSHLETILAEEEFGQAILARAAALRTRIVAAGLTKYNLGSARWTRPAQALRVILVPGQVESDASIARGAPLMRSNMALLRAVREKNPEAYIVYKPHPDVVARLRLEGLDERNAGLSCDEIVTDVAMGALLDSVDEVHVLTSLAGFEALLRGRSVTCYGQPFYAGWGLTIDQAPNERRQRKLTLDELVAGALILYPLYLSRDGRTLTTPEAALETLSSWRTERGGRNAWWLGLYRILLRRIAGVR